MKPIHLCFKSVSDFQSKCKFAFNDEGKLIKATSKFAFNAIGDLYKNDGEYNEDGDQIKPPTKIDGYHVNMLVIDPEIEKSIPSENIIEVSTPRITWAGVNDA